MKQTKPYWKKKRKQYFGAGAGIVLQLIQCITKKYFSDTINMARRKILCKRYSTKSRMALESRADSGLNPLFTESHGGQNGMRAGTA